MTSLSLVEARLKRLKLLKITVPAAGVLAFSVTFLSSAGQSTQLGYSNTPPDFSSGHDYLHLMNETVNPADGSVRIKIDLPLPQGRAFKDFKYSVIYNSSPISRFYQTPLLANGTFNTMIIASPGEWTDTLPMVVLDHAALYQNTTANGDYNASSQTCDMYQNAVFNDYDGAKHSLPLSVYFVNDSSGYCISGNAPSASPVFAAADSSVQAVWDGSLNIATLNGTSYKYSPPTNDQGFGRAYIYPYIAEDKNGNKINFSSPWPALFADNSSPGLIAQSVTDTLGRILLNISGLPQSASSISTAFSVAGEVNPYVLTQHISTTIPFQSTVMQQSNAYQYAASGAFYCGGPAASYSGSFPVTFPAQADNQAQFVLPNGQSYKFDMDAANNLTRLTYPSGAFISYTWAIPGMTDDTVYTGQHAICYIESPCQSGNSSDEQVVYNTFLCVAQYGLPQISRRSVSFDGVHIALVQDYSYSTTFSADPYDTSGWKTKTTKITTNDLVSGQSSSVLYSYLPDPQNVSQQRYMGRTAVEYLITYYDGSGNVLMTKSPTFQSDKMISEITSLSPSNLTSKTDYFFNGWQPKALSSFLQLYPGGQTLEMGSLMFPGGSDQYDWGPGTPGPLLKTTSSIVDIPLASPAFSFGPADFEGVSKKVTQDGSGNIMAETDYQYTDNVAQIINNVVQHDPAYDVGSTPGRHNVLSTTTKCFPSCTDSVTTYKFDNTGQLALVIDPRGNTTNLSFADAYTSGFGQSSGQTNAYLTSVTRPAVNMPHISSFTYGFNDGKMRSSTDENSQVTQYCYFVGGCAGSAVDPFLRLTEMTHPGGGTETVTYNDSDPNPSTTDTIARDNLSSIVETTVYDGMGHATQSQLNSDGSGVDYTDTTYDGLGRPRTISNPYRSTSDSTYGLRTMSYDALSRVILNVLPDGSSQTTSYSGNAVDSYDEAGVHLKTFSDALGRLTDVYELGTSANLQNLATHYGYNALGDLTSVNQLGNGAEAARTRSFSYDSLSRLLTSQNPETGIVCYGQWTGSSPGTGNCLGGYDPNGNLLTKTDARGAVTNYSYDALSRLLTKTYSGSSSAANVTPPVSYMYDASATGPVPNAIGRLTSESTDGSGANTASTERDILQYDAMGRVQQDQQCVSMTGSCPDNLYVFQYSYDLAGNRLTSTNGFSTTPLTNTYDTAGRLETVTWNEGSNPLKLFSPIVGIPQYVPAGLNMAAVNTPATIGQPIFTVQRMYDTRLRVTNEFDTAAAVTAVGGSESITFTAGDGGSGRVICRIGSGCSSPTPDAGTISITVTTAGGTSYTGSVDYDGESDVELAGELQAVMTQTMDINGNPQLVSAQIAPYTGRPLPVGDNNPQVALVLTSLATGVASDTDQMTVSITDQDDYPFYTSGGSFTGGVDPEPGGPVYSFGLNYFANSNIQNVTDSVMGNWSYMYDGLNRLATAQSGPNLQNVAPFGNMNLGFGYDNFGNFLGESVVSGTPLSSSPPAYTYTGGNNRIDGMSYDASGNVLGASGPAGTVQGAGVPMNLYDAESRLYQSQSVVGTLAGSGAGSYGTLYVYDAEGRRVAKLGAVTVAGSCPPWVHNCPGTTTLGITNQYLLGLGGEQVTELDGLGNRLHSNVYAGGKLLATYEPVAGLHFQFSDWLGTRRVQAWGFGQIEETCVSLPYGDNLNCSGPGTDVTEQHFTGKERDNESGLDYFGARYYASSMGRFMSPDDGSDWDLSNPQSWNLYSYVRNNPLTNIDPDGHDCVYLNNAGNGAEEVDHQSSQTECTGDGTSKNPGTGGYWVDGTASSLGYDPNSNAVALTGVYNGQQTSSSYGFSDSITVNGNSSSPQLNTVDISIGAMLSSPYPKNMHFQFEQAASFTPWQMLKRMANCYNTDDPKGHIGPKAPETKASTDTVNNGAASLNMQHQMDKHGNTTGRPLGNKETTEAGSTAADAAGLFNDIANCAGGK